MTDESQNTSADLRSEIETVLNHGMTQTELAKQCGLSAAVISRWLKSAYTGNNETVESKLSAWLQNREAGAAIVEISGPRWVATPTSLEIERALTFARARPTIAVIYGSAGVGKTTTIERYAKASPNVWMVTVSPATASMAAILREIGAVLELHGSGWQNRALSRDIKAKLKGTNGLLVIDEAQHLGVQAVEEIRSIHDASKIGLVLCGNEKVYTVLTGGNRSAVFAQLFSRVGRKLKVGTPKKGDIDAILDAWGLTGAPERDYAHRIAAVDMGFRGLINVLDEAALVSQGSGVPVNVGMLRMVRGELGAAS